MIKAYIGCIILIFIFIPTDIFSQYYYYNDKYYDNDIVFEIGGGIGAMNAITDIGGQGKGSKRIYLNEINWRNTQSSANVFLVCSYRQIVAVRLEATYGNIKGYDSLLQKGTGRYKRNLSYRSPIREVALSVEFHPNMIPFYDNPPTLSPYLIAGFGWFTFNPQANLNGNWIDLQPLHTEGQGFKEYPDRPNYRLSQGNILLGTGLKFELSPLFNCRLEWVHRYLFTDYLDDVSTSYIDPSFFNTNLPPNLAQQAILLFNRTGKTERVGAQRGDPKNKDAYFTINFKVGVTLGRTRR